MMIHLLAQKSGKDLREHGISLISVEGLNFNSFMPLFGKNAIKIPVAVLTDADPAKVAGADGKEEPHYPETRRSDHAFRQCPSDEEMRGRIREGLPRSEDLFEYDFALYEKNRAVMLDALEEIHPQIAAGLRTEVAAAPDDTVKARALFSGMFERKYGNVQKGRFGQTLAAKIVDGAVDVDIPPYIVAAIEHVAKK